jgi:hypothetical protein
LAKFYKGCIFFLTKPIYFFIFVKTFWWNKFKKKRCLTKNFKMVKKKSLELLDFCLKFHHLNFKFYSIFFQPKIFQSYESVFLCTCAPRKNTSAEVEEFLKNWLLEKYISEKKITTKLQLLWFFHRKLKITWKSTLVKY